MTLTTHAATGIIVTQWTNSPVAGFFAALMSHYVLDMIPHGDEFIYWRHVHNKRDRFAMTVATVDVLVLIVLVLSVLFSRTDLNPYMIMAGAFGGILPDIFITLHTNNRGKFRDTYAGLLGSVQKGYHHFLQRHLRIHHAFHGTIHAPIRFRTAVFYQLLFLIGFAYFYMVQPADVVY